MKIHRFFIEEKIESREQVVIDDKALVHQLKNVFRYKTGDRIILCDDSGAEFSATIFSLTKEGIRFSILERTEVLLKSNFLPLVLCCSIIKKQNFEWIVEKCTEIGVSEFIPIISERSEKKAIDEERIRRILKESSEQSGRTKLPILHETVSLYKLLQKHYISEGTSSIPSLVLDPSSEHSFAEYIKNNETLFYSEKKTYINKIFFFVGPEGGWSQTELDLFISHDMKRLSLGKNILRTETAAIASTGILLLN